MSVERLKSNLPLLADYLAGSPLQFRCRVAGREWVDFELDMHSLDVLKDSDYEFRFKPREPREPREPDSFWRLREPSGTYIFDYGRGSHDFPTFEEAEYLRVAANIDATEIEFREVINDE